MTLGLCEPRENQPHQSNTTYSCMGVDFSLQLRLLVVRLYPIQFTSNYFQRQRLSSFGYETCALATAEENYCLCSLLLVFISYFAASLCIHLAYSRSQLYYFIYEWVTCGFCTFSRSIAQPSGLLRWSHPNWVVTIYARILTNNSN